MRDRGRFGLSRELEDPEPRPATLASLRRAFGGLPKKAEAKEDPGSRRVARRVLEGLRREGAFQQILEEISRLSRAVLENRP